MANKSVFKSASKITATSRTVASVPKTNTVNAAGGKAYSLSDKAALAQIAATNCFSNTFYADANTNLDLAKKAALALKGDPEFIAKTAIYCRDKSYMKDMPAFLMAVLATIDSKLFRRVFPQVIDNVKMLRNFVQIGRSGAAGKVINMSSGAVRHAIRDWFASKSSTFIFKGSLGNDPSMKDILKMARPKPENAEKAALYAYLKDSEFDSKENTFITRNADKSVKYSNSFENLPTLVKEYEAFKKTKTGSIPNVDFRMLDSFLDEKQLKTLWKSQAETASWTVLRMNLNNFAKYGVFDTEKYTETVAKRLSDKTQVANAKAYPYQLMCAYKNSEANVPMQIKLALQDAMEHSIENVPTLSGKTLICVDVSGSMSSPVTGNRGSSTTKVTCLDVASLFACSILRKNQNSDVVLFDTKVHNTQLNPRDSVMTNSLKLSSYRGGGTDCASAMRYANQLNKKYDNVIFVSDNESWVDRGYYSRGTGLLNEWEIFKKKNPNSKLVCIDLQPSTNSQLKERKDILLVGGWSDSVFDVISSFVNQKESDNHWIDQIQSVEL